MMGGVLIYGCAAVLGGLTSPFGAVVGGFWSASSKTSPAYIPGVGNVKLPIALALIITVLVVKPAGLFGRPIVKRV